MFHADSQLMQTENTALLDSISPFHSPLGSPVRSPLGSPVNGFYPLSPRALLAVPELDLSKAQEQRKSKAQEQRNSKVQEQRNSKSELAAVFRSPRESIFSSGTYPKSILDAYNDESCSEIYKEDEPNIPKEEDAPECAANTTSTLTLTFGKRFRMSMSLKTREIALIRNSWSILLDNECPKEKYDTFVTSYLQKRKRSFSKDGPSSETDSKPIIKAANNSTHPILNEDTTSGALFGSQFLANILDLAPQIEKDFPTITHAAAGVTGVLTLAINNLEDLSVLDDFLCGLGKRHARILGVYAEHFKLAGAGFLKTLRDRFGFNTTKDLEEVWSRLYLYLANSMLQFGIDPVMDENVPPALALEMPAVIERQTSRESFGSSSRSDSEISFDPFSTRTGSSSDRSNYTINTSSKLSFEGNSSRSFKRRNEGSSRQTPKSVRGGGSSSIKPGGKWVPVTTLPMVIVEESSSQSRSVRGGGASKTLVRRADGASSNTPNEAALLAATLRERELRTEAMRQYAARSGGARGGGGDCAIM
ncbi:LANO_0E00298g1_1 [Lachancea nothofagi CBS 11611]|uniref:LANO_0E00298g1_1 n=1 Tax=Lachancea nothofagi CBS 11611 TaxID=1266666 RepID=A0A1G4JNN1_9SACH|nr:LANO_0E00298g1_1 [Lachancea nothofagi CBS 11611]